MWLHSREKNSLEGGKNDNHPLRDEKRRFVKRKKVMQVCPSQANVELNTEETGDN